VGANLRAALDWLPRARTLITVKIDCDLSHHVAAFPDALAPKEEDNAALRDFFVRNGFRTWLREVEEKLASAGASAGGPGADPGMAAAAAASAPVEVEYETVLTEAQLERWLERISE